MSKKTLPYELRGNQTQKQILIFIHGWPDTLDLWEEIIPQFENNSIIINISYNVNNIFGIDFPEINQRLKNTIDIVDGGRNL